MSFVLCVCGGRDYDDAEHVWATLDRVHAKRQITELVQGQCPTGADYAAREWALVRRVPQRGFAADWEQGPKTVPMRNAQMVAHGLDGLLAFPGGRGTADMVRQARGAGVTVMQVEARS